MSGLLDQFAGMDLGESGFIDIYAGGLGREQYELRLRVLTEMLGEGELEIGECGDEDCDCQIEATSWHLDRLHVCISTRADE